MKKDDLISEEQLNAFVDGELDAEEKSALFSAADKSPELDKRLCQQRKLKELVQHAYRDIPEPRNFRVGKDSRYTRFGLTMVASLFLMLGIASGWIINGLVDQRPGEGAFAEATRSTPASASESYILHLGSGEPQQMKLALQKARELLASAKSGEPRRVELVVNGMGLDLLRSDVSLFTREISALAEASVVFYACSNAIERAKERGVEVHLVPEAKTGFTAIDLVVTRMKDGWQYFKI